jgi:hypothetical protein
MSVPTEEAVMTNQSLLFSTGADASMNLMVTSGKDNQKLRAGKHGHTG